MATITAAWTEAVNLHSSGTVAGGASATDDIDIDASGYDIVDVTIEIAFGGSPDGDCVVEFFPSTDSGTNDDTIAISTYTIPYATSVTKRVTIPLPDLPYVAVKLSNNDSTDNVTYNSWYAGRKWSSV